MIFTPRAGSEDAAAEEDDGYLLTTCFDGRTGTSSLLVLDARNVAAGPVARVPLSDEYAPVGAPLGELRRVGPPTPRAL